MVLCGINKGPSKDKHHSATVGGSQWFIRNGAMMLRKQTTLFGKQRNALRIFTYDELRDATNKFDSQATSTEIYNSLFRGTIDERPVCVSMRKKIDDEGAETSVNEIVTLANIHHPHIVQILGCCLETQVPLAVYEFIPNGTLADHMAHRRLAWVDRIRVAAEVAEALCYLHCNRASPIIHGNVEPSNVMLDETGAAKLIDFGFCVAVPLGETQLHLDCIAGTVYYLDPEYCLTGNITDKSDVYAYGMLLAVLFTGRFPDHYSVSEMLGSIHEVNASTVYRNRKKAAFEIGGPKMRAEKIEKYLLANVKMPVYPDGAGRHIFQSQLSVIVHVIQRCLHLTRDDRPSMNQVARELIRITTSAYSEYTSRSEYIL